MSSKITEQKMHAEWAKVSKCLTFPVPHAFCLLIQCVFDLITCHVRDFRIL